MPGKHRCIILIVIINTLGTLTNGQEWPILLFKEADSGVIPCIPRGQTTTFFWTRGEWYNISDEIAYNVNGVSGPVTEKFHVFSNGSLLLKNMTLMDEGNYYCRITSDRTECHGSVTVHLKATNTDKLPYIDRCSPNKGCTIYEKPSSTSFLTCKANQVSSDMSLKWFNESKEITDDVEESQDKNAMNETIISSTIKIKYDEPQFLTCQASSMKMETAFAHVQLQSEPVHGTSAGITVFTVVLGVTCVILLGFLLYTFVKQNRDKKTKPPDSERPDGEKTLFLNEETDPIKEDVDKLKKKISAEQKRTQELRDELSAERAKRSKDEKNKEELVKELSAERAKRSMEEKIKEELKETLQNTETDLRKLERLQLEQNAINEQGKGEGKQLNETIANFMRKIEEKDQKLQNAELELRSTSEKLKSLASQLQAKDNELKSLISQLKAKAQEIKATKDTLQKTRDILKAEETKVREIENKLKLSEKNLTAAKSEIKKLSRSHELYQRQLRSNVLEGKDKYSIFCRIKTAKLKTDSYITRKDEVVLKTTGSEYKYSFIFPENATREDIFARLEDLVQNAIDGGKSAILMHGNSPRHNMYVMYGNEVDEGIVFKTIHKIFYVSKKWTNIGYVAEVNASFAKLLPGKESHFMFSTLDGKPKDNTKYVFTNDDLAVKGLKVSVPTEEMAISFLKKYTETQTKTDGKQLVTNDFVQFFITTKFQSEEISTGTLTFVLYNDVEALKDCFKSHNKTPLFPHYFASMINAEGSKVRILSNIEEDKKEEAKEHLKFSYWIVQEKSSFTTRFKEKLGFAS